MGKTHLAGTVPDDLMITHQAEFYMYYKGERKTRERSVFK